TLQPGNGMPTLLVQTFEAVGMIDPRLLSAAVLLDKIREAFSRFDAINIAMESRELTGKTDYRLRGLIEYLNDGTVSVRFNLIDAADSTMVWSRSFERIATQRDRVGVEDRIAADTATTLLQPFGIIRSRERVKHLAGGAGDPRYRCLLLASD